MLIRRAADILPSEITPPGLYHDRRRFLAQAGGLALAAALPGASAHAATGFGGLTASPFSTTEAATSRRAVTTYNNFYELGTDKSDPAENTHRLKPSPWTLRIEGLVNKPLELRGVEVSALLCELPDGRWKLSLRSRERVDVNAVCRLFGGGGHRLASGAKLDGPLQSAQNGLDAAVLARLQEDLPEA